MINVSFASAACNRCRAHPAGDLVVLSGVNTGDALLGRRDLCPGDIYEFRPSTEETLAQDRAGADCPPCPARAAGNGDGALTRLVFMSDDARLASLVLIEPAGEGPVRFVPLSPLAAGRHYTLIAVEPATDHPVGCGLTATGFAEGTRIALADGGTCPVERLAPGSRLLALDGSPLAVHRVLPGTVRADGNFAPVVIAPGRMGNDGPLKLGQHQRVFMSPGGNAKPALLIQARDLVDGEGVRMAGGGHADMFNLVLDRPAMILAEGVPVENTLVADPATMAGIAAE